MPETAQPYTPHHSVRIVTAGSLFDGHDVAINIMRRIIQDTGCEVIHLGHNRSVLEIVDCAIQEDVHAIAVTSYQGGHMEFFKYMFDMLKERQACHIKIFGGGGGTILPEEKEELMAYGITRIYSPDEGREMGLQGMIEDLVRKADFPLEKRFSPHFEKAIPIEQAVDRMITVDENFPEEIQVSLSEISKQASKGQTPVLGITGSGGSGKSSLIDDLVRWFLIDFKHQESEKKIAIISVDPSKRKTM